MVSKYFIERPILAWVLAAIIMLAGVLALMRLPVAQYPDIAPPSVRVTASYPGASARVVEDTVTQILEQELKGLDRLLYFSAGSSSSGEAELVLTFEQGADAQLAQLQVQNKVNQAQYRLPRAVQQNGVQVAAAQNSFLMVGVFYDASARLSDSDIADWASGPVMDAIGRLPGVGEVRNFGSPHAMRVWLDPHRLHSFGLMPGDVVRAIEAQNAVVPVGELGARPSAQGQRLNVSVTAQSRLQTPEQFRALVLKSRDDGGAVRLDDVARVEVGSEQYGGVSRMNGLPASGFAVMLAPGANALETAAAVRARIAALAPTFPPGLRITYPEDATRFVKLAIRDVVATLLEAVLLVAAVMLLFLRSWRATLVPVLTVPVVLLGTVAVLSACGFSINTLTLFGMVLAIGLLVDDAIVVVENVERIMHEQQLDARAATLQAMRGMTGALAGIAVVLGAVFVPMGFFSGSVGVIYRQFSITLASAMALSVLAAVSIAPVLCAALLRPGTAAQAQPGPLQAALLRLRIRHGVQFKLAHGAFGRMLGAILGCPLRAMLVYGLLAAGALLLAQRLPTSFLPEDDQGTVMVKFALPSGATYERTAAVAQDIERYFLHDEQAVVDGIYTIAGFGMGGAGQNAGMAFVSLKDWTQREGQSVQDIAARATQAFAARPALRDARAFAMAPPPIDGLGEAGGFEFWLQAADGAGSTAHSARAVALAEQASQLPGMLYVEADGAQDKPRLHLDIDQGRAQALGLDIDDVNRTLSTAWGGAYVNDYLDQGRVRKVMVQADAAYRASPDDVNRWFVRGAGGAMAPLAAFANGRWESGPSELHRFNGLPAVHVTGAGAPGASSGAVMAALERQVAATPGTQLAWSGLSFQERLSGGQAPLLYAASVLFVFLCLAVLYGNWAAPLAVLLAVPLGVVGAVAAVTASGLARDIYFQVGVLATAGLAAKNAILIVECAESALRAGMAPLAAAVTAAMARVRPIVMTSLAFGAGIVPLVLATGPGAGAQQAIGASVLGGMVSSTALGVFIAPLCWYVVRGGWRRVVHPAARAESLNISGTSR
ncbi:MAG: multidrug efflux RND transporter permease subunit [Burkholderiaceae bacterium]|nr:multidrug efflux RND transporter permease subunit [Burkholderiaceae bacterium]